MILIRPDFQNLVNTSSSQYTLLRFHENILPLYFYNGGSYKESLYLLIYLRVTLINLYYKH